MPKDMKNLPTFSVRVTNKRSYPVRIIVGFTDDTHAAIYKILAAFHGEDLVLDEETYKHLSRYPNISLTPSEKLP